MQTPQTTTKKTENSWQNKGFKCAITTDLVPPRQTTTKAPATKREDLSIEDY